MPDFSVLRNCAGPWHPLLLQIRTGTSTGSPGAQNTAPLSGLLPWDRVALSYCLMCWTTGLRPETGTHLPWDPRCCYIGLTSLYQELVATGWVLPGFWSDSAVAPARSGVARSILMSSWSLSSLSLQQCYVAGRIRKQARGLLCPLWLSRIRQELCLSLSDWRQRGSFQFWGLELVHTWKVAGHTPAPCAQVSQLLHRLLLGRAELGPGHKRPCGLCQF